MTARPQFAGVGSLAIFGGSVAILFDKYAVAAQFDALAIFCVLYAIAVKD